MLSLLAYSSLCFAQYRTGVAKPAPALNTVREFCRQDFLGGRLTPEGWARMQPLTNWKDNPAWRGVFRIVSRYEQTDEVNGYRSARILVRYQLLGTFEMGIGFTPLAASESFEFKLRESDGEWKIESTDPERFDPHVSRPRAIQWLQDKLKTTTDKGEKISIESALNALQPAK